jgi:predicted CoA-binding protein
LSQNQIREILEKYHVVAVVGLSREVGKPSRAVAAYLKGHAYHVIPVNPFTDEVLGEKSYPTLSAIPEELQKTIEGVDIFRPATEVPPIVDEAIKLRKTFEQPFVVWMQSGIVNEKAAEAARDAGLVVVMDRCMMVEHRHLQG